MLFFTIVQCCIVTVIRPISTEICNRFSVFSVSDPCLDQGGSKYLDSLVIRDEFEASSPNLCCNVQKIGFALRIFVVFVLSLFKGKVLVMF